ncbi:MAG: pseudouridine synthase [Anaerolineae bacterium]
MARERLQKVIAAAGLCSRRRAETLITAGRVQVNGEIVTELGAAADPRVDTILVDGTPLAAEPLEYWAVNKPPGVVTTLSDPEGRPLASDLVPTRARVYPVGRLDVTSSGLLIFTNDGEMAHHLMHPRFAHSKVYHVLVSGYPSEDVLNELRGGVTLEDGPTQPAQVRELRTTADGTWLEITLREGRKRQIRRMMALVGYPVVHLKRVAIGPVQLGKLPVGAARPLAGRCASSRPDQPAARRQPPQCRIASAVKRHAERGRRPVALRARARAPKGAPRPRRAWPAPRREAGQAEAGVSAPSQPPAAGRLPRAIAVDGPAAVSEHRRPDARRWPQDASISIPGRCRALTWLALTGHVDVGDGPALARLAAAIDRRVGRRGGRRRPRHRRRPGHHRWPARSAVDARISVVSQHAEVRAALLGAQRDVAVASPVVMVGRDIGTVVLPNAGLKVFLEASPIERARRRFRERLRRGECVAWSDELAATIARDERDRNREHSPLVAAADAMLVDTDALNAEGVVSLLLRRLGIDG